MLSKGKNIDEVKEITGLSEEELLLVRKESSDNTLPTNFGGKRGYHTFACHSEDFCCEDIDIIPSNEGINSTETPWLLGNNANYMLD